jgi:hypothetical protein
MYNAACHDTHGAQTCRRKRRHPRRDTNYALVGTLFIVAIVCSHVAKNPAVEPIMGVRARQWFRVVFASFVGVAMATTGVALTIHCVLHAITLARSAACVSRCGCMFHALNLAGMREKRLSLCVRSLHATRLGRPNIAAACVAVDNVDRQLGEVYTRDTTSDYAKGHAPPQCTPRGTSSSLLPLCDSGRRWRVPSLCDRVPQEERESMQRPRCVRRRHQGQGLSLGTAPSPQPLLCALVLS